MTTSGYPFHFESTDLSGADAYLEETFVYSFDSTKSGHHYVVRIERYIGHLYCVKFYDETTDTATGKFSHLSATYEPRTIFRTVADIALHVYYSDREASFFFIGAADSKDEPGVVTRRYRVYSNFLFDLELDRYFEIHLVDLYSMCVLVNRQAVPDMSAYMNRILHFIAN